MDSKEQDFREFVENYRQMSTEDKKVFHRIMDISSRHDDSSRKLWAFIHQHCTDPDGIDLVRNYMDDLQSEQGATA